MKYLKYLYLALGVVFGFFALTSFLTAVAMAAAPFAAAVIFAIVAGFFFEVRLKLIRNKAQTHKEADK